MASVTQALLATPAIVDFFLCEGHTEATCRTEVDCLACAFDSYVASAYGGDADSQGPVVSVDLLYAWWKNQASATVFAQQQQQDAHEFFLHFIEVAHANLRGRSTRRPKPRPMGLAAVMALECPRYGEDGYDGGDGDSCAGFDSMRIDECPCVFHKTFAGTLRTDLVCTACEATTHMREPTMSVSLDVPTREKRVELEESLRLFARVEIVDTPVGALHRVCGECGKTSASYSRQTRFERVPRMLNFHIKRFSAVIRAPPSLEGDDENATGGGTFGSFMKSDIHVNFPMVLDVSQYCTNDVENTSANTALYDLYAVIVHSGVLDGGHYIAYVRRYGEWFECDDAGISSVSVDTVKSTQAFMLFYAKRDE
jgi:ubiquitin carboxyl-terminal hydrolase 22/27/51